MGITNQVKLVYQQAEKETKKVKYFAYIKP